jgi:hypothetical protein
MDRDSAAKPDTGKSGRSVYRIGEFSITRERSRWHIRAGHSESGDDFATLGEAIVWCRQQSAKCNAASGPYRACRHHLEL